MKAVWLAGLVLWLVYAVPYVILHDSWWRILIALGVSLAAWEAFEGRVRSAFVALAAAWAVLGKVVFLGNAQNAPAFPWEPESMAYTWTAAGFLVAAIAAITHSPRASVALCLIGAIWGTVQIFGMWPALDILAEFLFLAALAFVWSDGDGGIVQRVEVGATRGPVVGGILGASAYQRNPRHPVSSGVRAAGRKTHVR